MKRLLVAFLLAFGVSLTQAQTVSLTVNVRKLKNNEGMVYLVLQDPTKKAIQQQFVPINKKEAQALFRNLKPGKYVVRLYHDENNNKKLDTGLFGMPTESWGNSNDVKAHFAPPKFDDMIFSIENDLTISVNLN
jgi:uncharacterized protein (DUF2141 family)